MALGRAPLWEEQQGASPEGKDSAGSWGGTEASTAGGRGPSQGAGQDPTDLLGLASAPGALSGNLGKN